MSDLKLNATIVHREDLCEGLWIIRVRPDEGDVPEFEAGQYAELGLPESMLKPDSDSEKILRRAYSIGSEPSQRDYLEFFVVRVDDGALTPKLYELGEGDKLWMGEKIKGKFTLDPIPENQNIITVATGTGLAPFISMLKENLGKNRWKRFVVIQGARYAQDLGYSQELQKLADENEDVVYISAVTREPEDSDWKGLRGRVNGLLEPRAFQELAGFELSPEDCQILLCGNPDMIDQVKENLEGEGFKKHSKRNPGNIHFERYW